jgi:hypothetical protein
MSEQTEMAAAPVGRSGDTTYTVQVAKRMTYLGDTEGTKSYDGWADIATVTVPRKSPRRKVIGLALVQSGIRPAADSEPLRVRVLDAASASETSVAAVQPEPLWKVG